MPLLLMFSQVLLGGTEGNLVRQDLLFYEEEKNIDTQRGGSDCPEGNLETLTPPIRCIHAQRHCAAGGEDDGKVVTVAGTQAHLTRLAHDRGHDCLQHRRF